MKFSTILSIAAVFVVAVAAGPTPVEENTVAAVPEVYEELSPFLGAPIEGGVDKREDTKTAELVAAASLIFEDVGPLAEDVEIETRSLEKRGLQCKKGYGLCPKSKNKCCQLGGDCCKKGCCNAGSWCYAGGCCKNNQMGCDNKSCCPRNSRCCKGGGCCASNQNCWISAKGKKGCCPVGKICA
ncbi:hypothetical protein EMPS_00054 [Entomortierella parvispora]|uniref:Uncharacterized protein n=1 Tax=Entomortierella parvispora TaxID=205924 RepID=A0A9P3H106_9FUNG|nr:hypothetical protein EMPS_00054 [Entomortierella parvispora]